MKYDDITSAIAVGATKSIVVFQDRPIWARGYVRTLSLHSENRVQVALDVEGMDEGGAYFWASYPSLEGAIKALEVFMSKPLHEWTSPALESVGDAAASADHGALETAIRDQAILRPVR